MYCPCQESNPRPSSLWYDSISTKLLPCKMLSDIVYKADTGYHGLFKCSEPYLWRYRYEKRARIINDEHKDIFTIYGRGEEREWVSSDLMKPADKTSMLKAGFEPVVKYLARPRLSGHWDHLYSTDTNRNHHYHENFIVERHASNSVLVYPTKQPQPSTINFAISHSIWSRRVFVLCSKRELLLM
jgi:hypothetical protein